MKLTKEWEWLRQANQIRESVEKGKDADPPTFHLSLEDKDDTWLMEWCIPAQRGHRHVTVSLTRTFWSTYELALKKEKDGWVPESGCKGKWMLKRLLQFINKYEQTYDMVIRDPFFDSLLCDRVERVFGMDMYTLTTGDIDVS